MPTEQADTKERKTLLEEFFCLRLKIWLGTDDSL